MPSGLAIGAGIAQGFEKASSNFLASMQAVQNYKLQREKFEIDKKVANLQMDKLGLELDPETHAQQKKLNDMKIKSMSTLMDFQQAKIDQIHNQTTNNLKNFQTGIDFIKTISAKDPEIGARIGFDAKNGLKIAPQAAPKAIPKDVYEQINQKAQSIATKGTNACLEVFEIICRLVMYL